MTVDRAKALRVEGIAAAKAGDTGEARRLLQQAIRLEPGSEAAWLWMASVAVNPRERLFCLQKTLQINPDNTTARKALTALQGAEDAHSTSADFISPFFGSFDDLMHGSEPASSGLDAMATVPMPSVEQIGEAQRQVEGIVADYLETLRPKETIPWIRKTRRRAGEHPAVSRRAVIVAAAVVAVLLVGGVIGWVVLNNRATRAVLFAPTPTHTPTPTLTATPTPGMTPTPSPTPAQTLTPSPTVPPNVPAYDPLAPPRPTDTYPRIQSQPLRNAVVMVDNGQIARALPTLAAERAAVQDLFDPVPYYYEALALAASGDGEGALRTLANAEARLTASNTAEYKPIIDAAYAIVYSYLADQSAAVGDEASADAYEEQLVNYANAALQKDRRDAHVHLALARHYRLSGDYARARQVIDSALAVPELAYNIPLILESGRLYSAQGDQERAMYQAFLALYMNPEIEAAHQLRTNVALSQQEPGLAVAYAEAYVYYFPGTPLAYKLLGDARAMEGKLDLALEAYSRALTTDDDSERTVAALTARADVYRRQGQYSLALSDLNRALERTDDPAIRAMQMNVAYDAGETALALRAADALLGQGVVPDAEINLLRARLLIDEAAPEDEQSLHTALALLLDLQELSPGDAATAQEYAAQIHYRLGNTLAGLNAINAALADGDTATRHYLRGLLHEARDEADAAARDYEWVLAWTEVYPFAQRDDVLARLESIRAS